MIMERDFNPTKYIVWAVIGLVGFSLFWGSWFKVDQTELAFTRRFGTVQQDRHHPIGPGVHFKLPWIDSVDNLQVSLKTIHIPPFKVLTVDNQEVTIEENFNYTIQPDDVYHVLYEVGRPGDVDVTDQVIPVAHDRTARIFAGQNMVTVNFEREKIQAAVEASVTKSVEGLFGITPHSLQIPAIVPSPAFMHSIDQATLAKNSAIQAENQLKTIQFQAQQVAAEATGRADGVIQDARGRSESTKLNAAADAQAVLIKAEAEKKRLVLEGEGKKSYFEAQVTAFGTADKYTDYLRAFAQTQWDGKLPTQMVPNGAVPFLNLNR